MSSDTLALPSSRLLATLDAILHGFRRHALLYGFAAVVTACALAEAWVLNLTFEFQMLRLFSVPMLLLLFLMILAGLGGETIRLARSRHEGSLIAALWLKLRDDYLAPQRVANAFHAFLFMSTYMVGYTFIKKAIPTAHPFSWDGDFARWDQMVHLGWHPYELLSFLNVPFITFLLNVNYNIWFFVMFTLWFWQGFSGQDTRLRLHFLLGFTLTWFLGTCVLGTVFSSVGPCFYGKLLPGADPYAPALAWLAQANQSYPIWSLNVMNELWKTYETGTGLVNGISAMPSMHVGTSVLFAMLGFASGKRWLAALLSAFALMIFLGSVHLTWHYAIDGYAGALIAVCGWWLAGRLINWARPDLCHAA